MQELIICSELRAKNVAILVPAGQNRLKPVSAGTKPSCEGCLRVVKVGLAGWDDNEQATEVAFADAPVDEGLINKRVFGRGWTIKLFRPEDGQPQAPQTGTSVLN